MEHLTIKLSLAQLHFIGQPTPNWAQWLNGIFAPLSDNYTKLAYELQREFKAGGSPDVTRISFDRIKYDFVSGQGSFRIVLDINFTFGCEDVKTTKTNQTSEWAFKLDLPNSLLHLYSSPFAESRSTADEF